MTDASAGGRRSASRCVGGAGGLEAIRLSKSRSGRARNPLTGTDRSCPATFGKNIVPAVAARPVGEREAVAGGLDGLRAVRERLKDRPTTDVGSRPVPEHSLAGRQRPPSCSCGAAYPGGISGGGRRATTRRIRQLSPNPRQGASNSSWRWRLRGGFEFQTR